MIAGYNGLDLVFWCLLLLPILFGLAKGFVRQIVPLVGLFVSFTMASRYYPIVHLKAIGRIVSNEQVAKAVAFGIVFLLVSILFSLLAHGLDKLLKAAMLSWLNRSLGAAAGLVKGGLYVLVLAYAVVMFADKDKPLVKTSRWIPAVTNFAETTLWPMIPEKDRKEFQEKKEKLLAYLQAEADKASVKGQDAKERAVDAVAERAAEAIAGAKDKAGEAGDAAKDKAAEGREAADEAVRRVIDEALPTRQ